MHSTIILLTCLIIIGCNSKPSTNNSLSQDEYDVYSAIINERLNRYKQFDIERRDTIKYIVIYHQTIKGSMISSKDSNNSFLKYIPSSELYELASEYSKVAKDTLQLNQQRINAPVKMINNENIDERNKYYYTQGVNLFSRVGFNINRNKALVYNSMWIEWGNEIMYLLKKENGKWIVVDGLINSFGKPELLSSIKFTKPTVGTPIPVPDANIHFADSTYIIK